MGTAESAATDESVFLGRRQLCQAMPRARSLSSTAGSAATAHGRSPGHDRQLPVPGQAERAFHVAPRKLTEEKYSITYNFYEFGSHKRVVFKTKDTPLDGYF